jgi:hypothetical protein
MVTSLKIFVQYFADEMKNNYTSSLFQLGSSSRSTKMNFLEDPKPTLIMNNNNPPPPLILLLLLPSYNLSVKLVEL